MSDRNTLPLFIYGIDTTTVPAAKLIQENKYPPYQLGGFISIDASNADKDLYSCPVYSKKDFANNTGLLKHIRALLINPKELDRAEKLWLSNLCFEYQIELLCTSSIQDQNYGKKSGTKPQKIEIEDVLSRIPVHIERESINRNLQNKTVLITGAAGSIGGEIARQISQFDVKTLLLCDLAESPLHELNINLSSQFPAITFLPLIADVKDPKQMSLIFETYKPHYVYHAAAYKHVPLMEAHPCEAILTNVLGTKITADLAVKYRAEVFVMISTDKAVNPSNIMGASKRIAEIYIQSLSKQIKKQSSSQAATRVITTRFGNVLGSNGSVIPHFKEQIKQGGPVTVTHPEIIRYFMTIPEACRLVLEAGNIGKGGEIFIFDMGDQVKIKDLAEAMIRLAGLEAGKDIEIVYTGLRPGEKLQEELLYDQESIIPTHNRKIRIGVMSEYNYEKEMTLLPSLLETARNFNKWEVVRLMKVLIPQFISHNSEYAQLDNKT
jgi:FlaA1/EpsC-like NDP-sugar epimerase